jgi:hypothetical protein
MPLTQLIYYSKVSETRNLNADYMEILREAMSRNSTKGITGGLICLGDYYIQVLEGKRAYVSEVYNLIAKDPRHHDVVLAGLREINKRSFAGWRMYGLDAEFYFELADLFSGLHRIDPNELGMGSFWEMADFLATKCDRYSLSPTLVAIS